jgi:hypothetical protein
MTSATLPSRAIRFASITLTAAAVLSCADRVPTALSSADARSDARYALATITVAPTPAAVAVGGTQAFTAAGRDGFGRRVTITPAWSVVAGGGSIHSSGLFTAGSVPGTYTNTVRATSGGISGAATVTVTPGPVTAPGIGLSPVSLGYTAQVGGGSPAGQTLSVSNTGGGTLSWTAKTLLGAAWLTLAPATGTAPATVTVSVNPAGLVAGTYLDTIQIAGSGAGNSPQKVPVSLTLRAQAGYATPDIVNNASFETGEGASGWSGFRNNSGGDPSPASGSFTVTRSTDHAYAGTFSVKSSFAANASDAAVAFTSPPFSQATVYARVWFYRTGALPSTAHKWIRFQTAGLNGVRGGLYLSSGNNDITWSEAVNSNIGVALGSGLPTANVWHSIEVEYDRSTWNVAGKGPRVRFWYDNAVRVGPSPTTYFGSGGTAYWGREDGTPDVAGPWLYAGAADGSAAPSAYLVFDDTYNGGNTQAGTIYYDRIAISSLGRIGP